MTTKQCKCGFSAQGNFCSNCGTPRQLWIFQIVKDGYYRRLDKALEEYSYDLETKDDKGCTALILAAKKGHRLCLMLLLERGADPNAKDNEGTTGLMWTAIKGHKECLQILLEDAFLNAVNDHGCTAVFFAVKFKRKDCLQILLECGADPNVGKGESALMYAAVEGNKDMLELLLKHGATVSAELKSRFPQYEYLWRPDLFQLVKNNKHQELEQALKEYSYDLEAKDDGETPLIKAAMRGYKECLEVLLEHKADPNAKSNNASTGLMWAVINGHRECAEILLDKVDLNAVNAYGGTAVYFAVRFHHKESLQQLLEHGADPNAVDDLPLILAARDDQKDIIQLLVKHGATVSPQLKTQYPQYAALWKPDIKDLLKTIANMRQQLEILEAALQ